MSKQYKILITQDGSRTLRDMHFDVPFHSIYGAVTESLHVFIRSGLQHVLQTYADVQVLEVGYGTGLNALLTALYAEKHQQFVYYSAVEPNPLDLSLIQELDYPAYLDVREMQNTFRKMHTTTGVIQLTPHFTLDVYHGKLEHFTSTRSFNLVYFDAFAPGAQPELWSMASLQRIAEMLLPGATFVTYCAKGQFKRDLKALGFVVESLPGPPGKREMVRGIYRPETGAMRD